MATKPKFVMLFLSSYGHYLPTHKIPEKIICRVESAHDAADIPIMLAMFAVADANRFVRHQNDDQY